MIGLAQFYNRENNQDCHRRKLPVTTRASHTERESKEATNLAKVNNLASLATHASFS